MPTKSDPVARARARRMVAELRRVEFVDVGVLWAGGPAERASQGIGAPAETAQRADRLQQTGSSTASATPSPTQTRHLETEIATPRTQRRPNPTGITIHREAS